MIRIEYLPENKTGRDLIIGDVHGCYHTLMNLLDDFNLDPNRDRVLSVGDLCDRGPDSLRCLQLHREPWFFGVLGNHEDINRDRLEMVAKHAQSAEHTQRYIASRFAVGCDGMGNEWLSTWLLDHLENWQDMVEVEALLRTQPHVIRVDGEHPYHVVHTELLAVGVHRDEQLKQLDGRQDETALNTLLWSRQLFRLYKHSTAEDKTRDALLDGLSPVYCGHSVIAKPAQYRSHVFLDTGCGYADYEHNRLTAYCVQEQRFMETTL